MRSKAARALLLQLNIEVDHLPRASVLAFQQALSAPRAELAKALHEVFGVDSATVMTSRAYATAAGKLKKALKAVADTAPDMGRTLVRGAQKADRLAHEHLAKELDAFARIFDQSSVAVPQLPAQSPLDKSTAAGYAAMSTKYATDVQRDIRRQLSLGVVKGETFGEAARRMARYGEPMGSEELDDIEEDPQAASDTIANGMFDRFGAWAKALIATAVVSQYNETKDDLIGTVAEDLPGTQKRWDAELDGRVCDLCEFLDGQVVDPDEAFTDDEGQLWLDPPAHPHCRCAVVLWRESYPDLPETT